MKIVFDDRWITLKGKKKKNGEDGKGGARVKLDDSGKIIAGLNGNFHGKTIAEMKAHAKAKKAQEAETKAIENTVKFNQDGYNKAVEKIKANNKILYNKAIANADKKHKRIIDNARDKYESILNELKEQGLISSKGNFKGSNKSEQGKRLADAKRDYENAQDNLKASYARAEKKYQLDNDNLVVNGCYSLPSVENKTVNNAPSNIGHVVKESEKAVMVEVEIDSPHTDHLIVKGVWIPKKMLDENGNAPDWYLEKRLKEIDNLHGRDNLDLPLFGYNSWYYGSKNYKNKNTQANKYSNIEVKEKKEKPKWFTEIENAEKEKSNNAQFNGKFYNNSKNEQGTYKIYVNGNSYIVNEKQKQEYEDYKANNKAFHEQAKKDATYLKIPYAERNVAKMAGAKWDAERKQWYMEKDLTIPEHLKSYIAKDKRVFMAQDKSARSYDKDGRMHVVKTNISKATVNPYYGYEIPNYEKLGLEPKRIYNLLRHPDELAKAVDTFKNLPLLDEHIPVNAKEPEKEHVVGSTGSDVEFKDGFLQCSLSIWDEQAIAGIESGEQKELSSAYYYDVEMTKGEHQGEQYDGIMRNIVGNHVALVDTGRAGRDVVVADKDPFKHSKGKEKMSKAKLLLKKLLAQDEDVTAEKLLDVVSVLVKEKEDDKDKESFKASDVVEDEEDEEIKDVEEVEKKRAEDEDVEEIGSPNGEDEDVDENGAEDEDETAEEVDENRTFTYEDVKKAIEKAVLAERKRNKDAEIAKKDVENIVGDVAMDSAKDIYKFALKQAGVDISGVHPSAYRAMVKMIDGQSFRRSKMASDKASNLLSKYPQLKNIRKG